MTMKKLTFLSIMLVQVIPLLAQLSWSDQQAKLNAFYVETPNYVIDMTMKTLDQGGNLIGETPVGRVVKKGNFLSINDFSRLVVQEGKHLLQVDERNSFMSYSETTQSPLSTLLPKKEETSAVKPTVKQVQDLTIYQFTVNTMGIKSIEYGIAKNGELSYQIYVYEKGDAGVRQARVDFSYQYALSKEDKKQSLNQYISFVKGEPQPTKKYASYRFINATNYQDEK